MILLPTRRRLERRRDALYKLLDSIIQHASVHQVEEIMRKIHGINLKLKTYFIREGKHEAAELFEDKDPFEEIDPFEAKEPTFLQIEEIIREIEI